MLFLLRNRKFRARLWWLVQSLAFVAMITTPLWIRRDFSTSPAGALVRGDLLWKVDDFATGGVISSEVINLDLTAENLQVESAMDITVTSRQLRFKARGLELEAPTRRKPAGKVANVIWHLSEIARVAKHAVEAELVPLVRPDADFLDTAETASVYVELDDGANDFVVTYRSSLGQEKKVPLVVRFKKNG